LTCRNLLIYLEPVLQKKVLANFHYSLNPHGFLMLGSSETIGQSSDLFTPLPGKNRLYQRRDSILAFPNFPTIFPIAPKEQHSVVPHFGQISVNLKALTDDLLLKNFTPAAVLTTPAGDIVYLSAKTGKYLEPTVGKANLSIFSMAREGLAGALNEGFARAIREKAAVILPNLMIKSNGSHVIVDVVIEPLSGPAAIEGMMLVVFREVREASEAETKGGSKKPHVGHRTQVNELAQELQRSREEVQMTREEMQSSQEELKAANEELQSMNEELQSTNEELTTSKEEMQSMNEELHTVNQELMTKVDELSRVRDDMENLLNSNDIATLFLDAQMKVRRFTPKATGIFKLIPGDTGRPITDQVTELDYPNFIEDVKQVLNSLVPRERRVSTRDGRWFLVRILPYRTRDSRIDGTVITLINISENIVLEETMSQALAVLQNRFDSQSLELEGARELENTLKKAQEILNHRFDTQALELEQAKAKLRSMKGKDDGEKQPDN
jgi:two-component system CheB/CheR fusion protein